MKRFLTNRQNANTMTKLGGQHVIRRLQTTASETSTSASDKAIT